MATPFVKWAGGKSRLVLEVVRAAPKAFGTYHEPFVGGGAVFFGLQAAGQLRAAVLNDANPALIDAYTVVRDDVEALIRHLAELATAYLAEGAEDRARVFYEARALTGGSPVERAARLIFLNRTCYNGLFRVNQRGEFNVPHGRYENPRILDAAGLRACSAALQGVELRSGDFAEATELARPGDFVYLDPPYVPLSSTSYFTSYTKGAFGWPEQERLAAVFRELTERGVAAVLSNSADPRVEALYAGFEQVRVPMSRAINSVGSKRTPIDELLVSNVRLLTR